MKGSQRGNAFILPPSSFILPDAGRGLVPAPTALLASRFFASEGMRKVARVRGIEVVYEDAGDGRPLLLLHGFPFNRSMWREQAAALSATCRVITPDLRGLGETSAGAEPATMEEMAEDLAALLDELNVGRAVVGG